MSDPKITRRSVLRAGGLSLGAALAPGLVTSAAAQGGGTTAPSGVTIILIHGAFATSSSWDGVIADLLADGHHVIAAANELRGLASDADYVSALVGSIDGPVVLAGHSYGGSVISNIASGNVKGLVFVAGLALDVGESSNALVGRFPGSTLGGTLTPPIAIPGGLHDLYVKQADFPAQFGADCPPAQMRLAAITQRPCTVEALNAPSPAASWKTIPSYFVFGTEDRNIPVALHRFMAERAGSRRTVEIPGASHLVMVSHPRPVTDLIRQAAAAARAG